MHLAAEDTLVHERGEQTGDCSFGRVFDRQEPSIADVRQDGAQIVGLGVERVVPERLALEEGEDADLAVGEGEDDKVRVVGGEGYTCWYGFRL